MTENPTAKYIKFWFCVTFSALFFNRRHFRSGNDNLTYRSKLSLLYAFQANSSIGMFIASETTEHPTAKYEKFWFRASLLINFGDASIVVSVAPINLAVMQSLQLNIESQESMTRNLSKSSSGLVSLAGIEYENPDTNVENWDTVIKNQVLIPDSILDSCDDRELSVNLLLNGTVNKTWI